jgi:hypothetical protein
MTTVLNIGENESAIIQFGTFKIRVDTEFPEYIEIEDSSLNAGIIVKREDKGEFGGIVVDIYPNIEFDTDPIGGTWVNANEFEKPLDI